MKVKKKVEVKKKSNKKLSYLWFPLGVLIGASIVLAGWYLNLPEPVQKPLAEKCYYHKSLPAVYAKVLFVDDDDEVMYTYTDWFNKQVVMRDRGVKSFNAYYHLNDDCFMFENDKTNIINWNKRHKK